MSAHKKLHIALLPWLAYGHIMPYLEVAKFLAQKGHRVSFISTPKNLQNIPKKALSPLIALVGLPLPAVLGLPDGAESTADVPIHQVPYLKKAFDLLQPSLTHFLHTSGLDWIVHDFNPHWLPQLAAQLGVNSGFLSIFNASTGAFFGPPSELIGGSRLKPEDFTVVPHWIPFPSTVAFKLHEINGHQQCMDEEVSDFERIGKTIEGSRFVAMRTCPEFEPDALSLLGMLYRKPVLPVGLLPKPVDESDAAGEGDEKWEVLRKWLDGKKEKSVVYVAFGTELGLSQECVHELARGIEKSGVSFIWVVNNRLVNEDPHIFPPRFETRVSDRGKIWTGFAPQMRILAHSSVGGFMTHSGWSSVIEVLGLGKPLVLFPGASSDLGLVARLLHSKEVGLEVPRDARDGSFTSDSVAKSIRRVMVDKHGESLRAKAWSARDIFGNMELQNKYLEEFTHFLENVLVSV